MNYALTETEFCELTQTMHLVSFVEMLGQPSETKPDITAEQLGAFTTTVADNLRGLVRKADERFEAGKGLESIDGLAPFQLAEIIDLLSGQRYVKVSRWREIEAQLERCAVVDELMTLALKAWRIAMDSEVLSRTAANGTDPVLRFRHLDPAHGVGRS